ncbi:hypothetical protein JM93_01684 [Roseibium hamelinense]|uniref:Uncharacterized protein n=1 Tax=Roseibium hamelinense TaxID=150831 RepID=A0A562T7B5_9HYPH|nr:hypothetical protein [Roseibium hamelinense]MTI42816.1 hypothetical protein [Roseibium hamelinense]TWI89481.1 hypothetical protein JM93_01684 [Roseibium hamelinense]
MSFTSKMGFGGRFSAMRKTERSLARSYPTNNSNISKQKRLLGHQSTTPKPVKPQRSLTSFTPPPDQMSLDLQARLDSVNNNAAASRTPLFDSKGLPLHEYKAKLKLEIKTIEKQRTKLIDEIANQKFQLVVAEQYASNTERILDKACAFSQDMSHQNVDVRLIKDFESKTIHLEKAKLINSQNGAKKHADVIDNLSKDVEQLDARLLDAQRQLISTYDYQEFYRERNSSKQILSKCKKANDSSEFDFNKVAQNKANKHQDLQLKSYNKYLAQVQSNIDHAKKIEVLCGRIDSIQTLNQHDVDQVNQLCEKAVDLCKKTNGDPKSLALRLVEKKFALKNNDPRHRHFESMVSHYCAIKTNMKDQTHFTNSENAKEILLKFLSVNARNEIESWKAEENLHRAETKTRLFDQLASNVFKHRKQNVNKKASSKSRQKLNNDNAQKAKSVSESKISLINKKKKQFRSDWNDLQIKATLGEFKQLINDRGNLDRGLNDSLQSLAEAEYDKCANMAKNMPKHNLGKLHRAQENLISRMHGFLDEVYNDPKRTLRYSLHQESARLVAQDMNTVSNRLKSGLRQLPYATYSGHGDENAYTIGQNQGKTFENIPYYLKNSIERRYSGLDHCINLKADNVTIYDATGHIPTTREYPSLSHGSRFNLRNVNQDKRVQNLQNPRFVTDTHNSTTVASNLNNGSVPATSITVHVQDDVNNGARRQCGTIHMKYADTENGRTVQNAMTKLRYRSLDDFTLRSNKPLKNSELADRKMARKLDALNSMQGSLKNDPSLHAKALKETLHQAMPDLDWETPADCLNDDNPQAAACLKRIPQSFLNKLGVKITASDSVEDTFDKITQAINKQLDGLEE